MYNNLLAYCGNSGDWVGAIRAYEVSSKTLIHHCNPMSQLPLRLASLAANFRSFAGIRQEGLCAESLRLQLHHQFVQEG